MIGSLPRWTGGQLGISCFFLTLLGSALLAQIVFWSLLLVASALGITFLAWRHVDTASAAWLLLAGLTLEMTLHDLIGPDAYAVTIAIVKSAQLALGVLCVLRYGPSLDPVNPAWVFVAMFAMGFVHGLHPGLTTADSSRSLLGSVAPFAFCFSRLPSTWARAMVRAVRWIPLLSVLCGGVLDVAGLRPLFVESGGERLAGLGHPAFLAGVCLPALYASLIGLYRDGRRSNLVLLGTNLLILVLTGARAPLAYGVMVIALSFAFVSSPALPARRRWLLLLGAATLVPLLALFSDALADMRLFNLLTSDSTSLSGRDLLWPPFEQAAAHATWLGWGLGAGNFIIAPGSDVAQLLHTWAAHNEYLRIEVEGGQVGRAILVGAFVLWVTNHTGRLPPAERRIMRLIFIAFAAHAATDNVLISTPACVLFSFVAAVFAGAPAVPLARRSGLPDTTALA